MGQIVNLCCVVDNEVCVKLCMICISLQKFNLVVVFICGKKVEKVCNDFQFLCKCIVGDVFKVFDSVIVNVENNYGFDIDSFVVVEVYVGKNLVMKCFCVCVCGCGVKILKLFFEFIIVVCEVEEVV